MRLDIFDILDGITLPSAARKMPLQQRQLLFQRLAQRRIQKLTELNNTGRRYDGWTAEARKAFYQSRQEQANSSFTARASFPMTPMAMQQQSGSSNTARVKDPVVIRKQDKPSKTQVVSQPALKAA